MTTAPIDANACLGTHDVLFITLDTLRYDVAMDALRHGETPNLASILPPSGWEKRHTPSTFTFGAHQAFFAGFLPTPATPRAADPRAHERLFAARFPGSETTSARTLVFDAPDIIAGFAAHGYRTMCIGGVGFFNKRSPLGMVLPSLFQESWWREDLGVACRESPRNQVALAVDRLSQISASERVFLFINVAACHEPTRLYVPGEQADSPLTQRAALAYADAQLPPLLAALRKRGPVLTIVCSDHGVAFGEDGYSGCRLAHPVVWEVPYLETILPQTGSAT